MSIILNDQIIAGGGSGSNGANTNLSNITNTGTSTGAGWAMPSNTYEDLTVGASGTNYTAPANGWVFVHAESTGTTQNLALAVGNLGVQSAITSGSGQGIRLSLPAKRGDTITMIYTSGLTISSLRFVYAVGSESEYTPS